MADSLQAPKYLMIFLMTTVLLVFLMMFSTFYFNFNWNSHEMSDGQSSRYFLQPKFIKFNYSKEDTVLLTKKMKKATSKFRPSPGIPFSNLFDKNANGTLSTVKAFIIVFTAPLKFGRRHAIRETWWKACKASPDVVCWFFTDSLESLNDKEVHARILDESNTYKDIIFMPIGSGILFGHRLLFALQWGVSHYIFRYAMRIDDDFLLCIDHFLWDIDNFPSKNLHWGYLHCSGPGLVYIDEGITMFSKDIVLSFLSQKPDKMLCHPFGDQTYTIWLQEIGINREESDYAGNDRIHHDPPASRDPKFNTMTNICEHFIALHGIYNLASMKRIWDNRGPGKAYSKFGGKNKFCPHKPIMLWRLFGGMYHAVPKLCREPATWSQGQLTIYPGRE